jgi:protein-tyrosine phosphatase
VEEKAMRPELFTIKRAGPGVLSTMRPPRGGDWLADDMRDLAMVGVGELVSLLSDSEIAELALTGEGPAAAAAGITFHWLPTPDRHVPDRSATVALAGTLKSRLREGAAIAIHCRHAIGRSSTLAAAVLVLEGLTPQRAWDQIAAARGLPVPDTTAQRDFISTLQAAT